MDIELLLSKLDKVKGGNGKWMACCPAHGDKSPSLGIKQAKDRILINCFAGCGATEVLDSIGLDYSALYPEERNSKPRPRLKPINPTLEIAIEVYKTKIRSGYKPTEQERLDYRAAVQKRHKL